MKRRRLVSIILLPMTDPIIFHVYSTGSLKKAKRENAMNEKKIFNICEYFEHFSVLQFIGFS